MDGMEPMNFQPDLGGISNNTDAVKEVVDTSSEIVEGVSSIIQDDGCFNYTCPRCGAFVSVNNAALGSYCVYCGGKGLNPVEGVNYSNYLILPFSKLPKDAISVFKNKIRFNPFVPFNLRSKKTIKNIKKIYLACSLCDFEVSGNVAITGADKVHNVQGAPMQVFESMYSTEFHYDNILTSSFPRVGDEIISVINNYNFSLVQPFQANYVTGTYILGGNVSVDRINSEYSDKILKHATSIVRGNNPHALRKVSENSLTVKPSQVRMVLVPIYFLNVKDKGKDMLFVMNGQTGESFIELPISVLSGVVFSVVIFSIVFLVTFLLAHLF